MMDREKLDAGTIAALMIRTRDYRLPRAQRMLEKVKDGELLSEEDIAFLRRVFNDSRNIQSLVSRHPEYHDLVCKMLDLYFEIISTGLENEKAQASSARS
jgi:hypothetical protein